jgi:inhibitor of KinA
LKAWKKIAQATQTSHHPRMRCVAYGPNAWLVQFADRIGDEAFVKGRALVAELERRPPSGLVEFVPAYTTLLLEFDPHQAGDQAAAVSEWMAQLEAASTASLPETPVKEIPVVYDGRDLDRVAQLKQLTVEQVCALHAAPIYKVYVLGFAPGFPYLGDLNPQLHTPRLASPRSRVPVGSVGIGGEHTGIYTIESPGGWNIIGHTPLKIFDPIRRENGDEAMFLLKQGDRVRLVPAEKA